MEQVAHNRREADRAEASPDDDTQEIIPISDGRAPIGQVLDKIVIYVFTGMLGVLTSLIGWLCIQTISLKQDTTTIIEHNKAMDRALSTHEDGDRLIRADVDAMKILMAQHGWTVISEKGR